MRRWVVCLLLVTAGCNKSTPHSADTQAYSVSDADPAQPKPAAPDGTAPAPIAVSVPQMAYDYKYEFRLPGEKIAAAQQAHVALCDRLGPARCQVLALDNSAGDEQNSAATLKLRVASAAARAFGAQLEASVNQAGGRALSRSISGEDVSKDIVDTEARLAQRTLLVARLTEILRTRKGSVADLVAAERSVADAQQEIDQAKGELAELRGRVAMSTVEISYAAVAPTPGSPRSGLSEAVIDSWSTFVIGIGMLARLVIYLLPWLVVAGLVVIGARRVRRRMFLARTAEPTDNEADAG